MRDPRNSPWCKELLGLSGASSALSAVPATRRPLIDLEPVGREADREWLRTTVGDRVLSGQPGSGKTFLVYHLMRNGWDALFLASDDEAAIANALRDRSPTVVVVDDAHADPGRVDRLVRLRREIDADFSILATTWEGSREQVVEALGGLPADRVRKLELLTRAEILAVIRQVGVEAHDDVLRDLVDQAANKPGLAVTIASSWLQGSWQEVLAGTVLSRTILGFFQDLVGPSSADVLAGFSLGGDRGMGVEAVREYLGLSRPQLRQTISGLAAGGVLSEVGKDAMAVWPRQLRFALLRSVFFSGTPVLLHGYQGLLQQAPGMGNAVETLVAARAYGAEVPLQELQTLVAQAGSRDAWQGLAASSEADALWVLEQYPGDVEDVAPGTIRQAPEATVRRLLKRAAVATDPVHSESSHPMRILSHWLRELDAPPAEMLHRRRLVARTSRQYLEGGGVASAGVHGICLALDPTLEGGGLDPGARRTLTISWGVLPLEQLGRIEEVWEEVRGVMREIDEVSWGYFSTALWNWMHPESAFKTAEVPEETKRMMRAFAVRVLHDLAPLVAGGPGLATAVADLAREGGIELPLPADPVFELLYPPPDRSRDERRRNEEEAFAGLKALAAQWAVRNPSDVAAQLARYEGEARKTRRYWSRRTPRLCRELAPIVPEPAAWLEAFLHQSAAGDLVLPFLERRVAAPGHGWQRQVERLLGLARYAGSAAELVLQLPSPPASLVEHALDRAARHPQLVETLCSLRKVPLKTLRTILLYPDWELALAAAVGEWNSEPQGEVRAEIRDEWRASILCAKSEEYLEAPGGVGLQFWLGVILARDPALALDWLRARLRDEDLPGWISEGGAFTRALSALDPEQRLALLEEIQPVTILHTLLPRLVRRDPAVYRKLLSLAALTDYHLDPLAGMPDAAWSEMAILALEAGREARAIAEATLFGGGSNHLYAGAGIEHWSRWDQAFAGLEEHPGEDLREVGRWGRRIAGHHLQGARDEERRVAVHGP